MANAKGKGTNGATAKGKGKKANKNVEVAEVTEVVETPVVEVSEEVVLDAPADITAEAETIEAPQVQEGFAVCSTCKIEKEQTVANFSPVDAVNNPNGENGFRTVCKSCQTAASLAWTTKRADYRKDYQRAMQLMKMGIGVIVPDAKTWEAGYVIMTAKRDENGKIVPDRVAEEVVAERKQAEADRRAELKAIADKEAEEAKAERKRLRDEAKAERERIAQEAADQRKADRDKVKQERDAKRVEDARIAKEERDRKNQEKADERLRLANEKAENARIERERKQAERLEAANKKAEDARIERERKDEEKRQAALDKALAVGGEATA
jgi:hypothetical protein